MNLKEKDRQILHLLELNARLPLTQLAKKIRLSKQATHYRLERLKEEGIIQEYNAIIDTAALGKNIHIIYLKLANISFEQESQWIAAMRKHDKVMLTAKNTGYWDLTIVALCTNPIELDATLQEIIGDNAQFILEKKVTSEIESSYFRTGLFGDRSRDEVRTSIHAEPEVLDDTDEAILHALSLNCRASSMDLSRTIGISANAITQRIKKLEQKNIILTYKAKINYDKLGTLHFRAFIRVNNYSRRLYESIKEHLKSTPGVESVSRYLGSADMEFRCHVKDIASFSAITDSLRQNFLENIIDIDSVIVHDWESISYYPEKSKGTKNIREY
jgi:Lrp/AsnC family transcriptional regulator, leucine-responsive regulatory protein